MKNRHLSVRLWLDKCLYVLNLNISGYSYNLRYYYLAASKRNS